MTGPANQLNRGASLLIVFVAYVLALALGVMAASIYSYDNPLTDVIIADVVATVVIFLFSYFMNNSSMYDPYWSVIPIPIAYYWMVVNPDGNNIRQWVILLLVSFWGLRLTINWIRGWPGLHHEDWRYVDLARQNGKLYWLVSFTGIHMFPTALVFGGMIPVCYGMASTEPFGLLDYLAAAITFVAVIIEWVSDEQLISYKKGNHEKGAFIKTGIWAYSRHPNYFGEVSFWVGLFIFVIGFGPAYYWTGTGALAVIILFVFISIPMMDKRHIASRKGYAEHMKQVSGLVPWFRKHDN